MDKTPPKVDKQEYGGREIFFEGRETGSFERVFEYNGKVTTYMKSMFDPSNDDETDEAAVTLEAPQFLDGIAEARRSMPFRIESRASYNGAHKYLEFNGGRFKVGSDGGYRGNFSISREVNFDSLFLDSFSVIENSESRRRQARDIILGPAEKAIVDAVVESPQLLYNFSHREFEVFIGSLLANIGFYNIRLSRYVKDGGYDLYALYCEGNKPYSVVIEVKHYADRKVSLELVDRLNGVRSRMGADKAVIFTSSQFTTTTQKVYRAESKWLALVDYEKLRELLGRCSEQWVRTPSDLWVCPSRTKKIRMEDCKDKA